MEQSIIMNTLKDFHIEVKLKMKIRKIMLSLYIRLQNHVYSSAHKQILVITLIIIKWLLTQSLIDKSDQPCSSKYPNG